MIKVSSKIKINMPVINQLSDAAVTALEQTAEALHAKVVQVQVVPRKDGALQGEKMFVDESRSKDGEVSIVHEGPYARRLYFHPEYKFHKEAWDEFIVEKDGKKYRFNTKDGAKDYIGKSKVKISHLTHEGNPNAKGKWFEDWEEGGSRQDEAIETYKRLYRRLTGI